MTIHPATRRELLAGAGVLFAWPFLPKLARAEGRDPRMLTIVLRGALDGLAAVAPVGDPDWVKLRGDKALVLDGKTPALPLDSFFALNPAMPNLLRLYKAGHAAIVHASATPYRERSHFDGQDVLESGLPNPGRADSGWLNRALGGLEPEARVRRDGRAFAVGPVTPLVVRGPTPVMSWTPARIQPASEDTMARLIDLYHHTDTELARAIEGRMDLVTLARASDPAAMAPTEGQQLPQGFGAQVRAYFADAAGTAAKFLARADGPRIGALAFNGWDTHIDEGADSGRLATLARRARRCACGGREEHGRGMARDRGRGGDGIRPHRAHQRHQRHRSRHRHHRAARGRRAQGRARDRRLAGAEERQSVRRPRPRGDDRPARGAERVVERPPARHRSGARRQRVPGQRRREADGRAGG